MKKSGPSLESLAADLAKLQSRVADVSRTASRAENRSKELSDAQQTVLRAAKGVDAVLEPLKTRALQIRPLLDVLIAKATIWTELPYLMRQRRPTPEELAIFHDRLVWALEQPDEWWESRRDWTLGEWIVGLNEIDPIRAGRSFADVIRSAKEGTR